MRRIASAGSTGVRSPPLSRSASLQTELTEEERLHLQVQRSALEMYTLVQERLVPVDMEPMPAIDLAALPAAGTTPLFARACMRAAEAILTAARDAKCGTAASTTATTGTVDASDATTTAGGPVITFDALGLTVCKGDPIQPTYAISSITFPGLVPAVKPQLPVASLSLSLPAPGSLPAAAAQGGTSSAASAGAPVTGGGAGATTAASTAHPHGDDSGAAVESAAPPIKCLEEIIAYQEPANKWVMLRFDRCEFPGGKTGRHNIVVEFGGKKGPGVCVLPITPDGHVLLIRQYRYCVGKWSWEVPRGGPEEGKLPIQQALAELEEETGYTTAKPTVTAASAAFDEEADAGSVPKIVPLASPSPHAPMGALMWPNAGISNTQVAFFAAVNIVPLSTGARPEATEAIRAVKAFPADRVYEMVRDGDIADQFTLCALALGMMHGLLPPPLEL